MKYTEAQLDQLKALQEKKNQEFLKDFILSQTESQLGDKWTDANLDKEIEKRHLLNVIVDFWQIESIERNILKIPSEYIKIFTQNFYKEIYRLCEWPIPNTISNKPWVVGRFTNEIIYFRFAKEVLPFLRVVNPYVIPGKRNYKHHQYLTRGARIKLEQFILEATKEMKNYENWDDFRIGYCKKYNVPYQLKFKFPLK
jgi:hypothetical protein